MLVGVIATVLFLILWRSGILDDLAERGRAGGDARWQQERKRLKGAPLDPEMTKRLEIFEEFLEELPDDEDE
ncbi:hypothetical protein MUP65_00905 [Patescibacteria group bacterium]|nr:hypothetical protein [Patescibacteria group bacterium]